MELSQLVRNELEIKEANTSNPYALAKLRAKYPNPPEE